VLLFASGALAAEGALHPQRTKVASVCPCIARVQCRDAAVTSPDGVSLRAWYYEPEASNGAAILVLHGIGATREDMVGLGAFLEKAGYNVLMPDLRGHGESGGIATYGIREAADIHAWADWLLEQPGINRIYGFGASLGGTQLLMSLAQESRFRGVIAESAYSSFPEIAVERSARLMPASVAWMATPFAVSGMEWARLRYGVALSEASPVDALRQTRKPVFLIHGLEDNLTSPENSRRLAAVNPAVTTLWLVPDGRHADIWARARGEFESRVPAWLAAHR
jgi:dipeptidyl aminopeptidase/acylaminoacyl peptidase